MADYVLSIQRRERNPDYKPEPMHGYGRDDREPNEREFYLSQRAMEVTLTESEFDVIKHGLIEYWAASGSRWPPCSSGRSGLTYWAASGSR
jgi:hypothetical protein